jgi:hypothetical protein
MAATIEVKYYNSFWLKKIASITAVVPGTQIAGNVTQTGDTITIASSLSDTQMNVGQSVTILYNSDTYTGFITERISSTEFKVSPTPSPVLSGNVTIIFGQIEDFTNIPKAYTGSSSDDWFIEEARIRGGYNNTSVDFGVKAYAVDDVPQGEIRSSSLIYSGIYNSRTGINNTNQFSVGEDITRSLDPANGSIQRLYAEDTNLIIFQEDKVNRALIDKDAIYSAEGQGTAVTTANLVIGQIVPYGGKYGISEDPESFAIYGYRKYFTDRRRNAVLRLSRDGIEEISRYGMTDFWRDELSGITANGTVIGGYDLHTKKYEVSVLQNGQFTGLTPSQEINNYKTLSFDESVRGWTSFYTYAPDFVGSLKNDFYSIKNGEIYKHYSNTNNRGTFYTVSTPANVTFIFNPNVSLVKNFNTINYEGSKNWIVTELTTNEDIGKRIGSYILATTQQGLENNLFSNNFLRKEDKYFANIINATPQNNGEILFGKSMSGIKGFFAIVKMTVGGTSPGEFNELFAVSTEYVESSY